VTSRNERAPSHASNAAIFGPPDDLVTVPRYVVACTFTTSVAFLEQLAGFRGDPIRPDWDGSLAGLPGRSFARFWSFSIAARPCALAAASLLVCVVQAGRLCVFASFGRLRPKPLALTGALATAGFATGSYTRKQRFLSCRKTPRGVLRVLTPKKRVSLLVLGTARASRKTEAPSARSTLWATSLTAAVSGESCWLPRNRYLK
jgi:hypothetical protein